jgi:hypothetical protein
MKKVSAVLMGEIGENLRPIFLVAAILYLAVGVHTSMEAGNEDVSVKEAATVNPEKYLIDLEIDESAGVAESTIPYSCPQDVHVSCLQYTGNPSDYGTPQQLGHYHITIINYEEDVQLNMCNIGHITRRWTIQTVFGTGTCTQRITVNGVGGFNPAHITWPRDYDLGACTGSVHPDDLPAGFGRPTWSAGACAMIGTTYQDQWFDMGNGGCRKLIRTWRVIDWCTYQSNSNPPVGLWTHIQVIKLSDKVAPVITHCPSSVTVSTDQDCNGVNVQLERLTATDDCSTHLTIRNSRNNGGADASGFYPLGTTIVTFTVIDGCGNSSTCTSAVTVRDSKPPTPIAHHGLVGVLMNSPTGPKLVVNASLFNRGSYDNCTPSNRLRFEIEPNMFDCENLGVNDIRFIVYDESGNSDWVYTYIIIQENMGMCPDSLGGSISGIIQSEGGFIMQGVRVDVRQNQFQQLSTNNFGLYHARGLKRGGDVFINPVKEESILAGVDSRDLVRLRRHITGEAPFTSAYRWLAADLNRSGTVDFTDYLHMRMMLLLGLDQFAGITPWLFYERSLSLEQPEVLAAVSGKSGALIENHGRLTQRIDFVAVKMGDVDGSYFRELRGRSSFDAYKVELELKDQVFMPGQRVSIPLNFNAYDNLELVEAIIPVDPLLFDILDIRMSGNTSGLEWIKKESGDIALIADFGNAADRVLYLDIRLKRSVSVAKWTEVISQSWTARAYDSEMEELVVNLRVGKNQSDIAESEDHLSVYPNPAKSLVNIPLHAAYTQDIMVQMTDLQGRVVQSQKINVQEGHLTLPYSLRSDLSGMHVLQVYINGRWIQQKIQIIE